MKKYKHIISLGFFCGPAMEFERINKRQFSLPFDWLITPDLKSIIALINNQFSDFLNEEYMYQFAKYPQYYRNTKWNIDFYHDFLPIKSFDSQINQVKDKYDRRIRRFYQVIQEPTLFLRFITKKDIAYINECYADIVATLKTFHPENDIIFVTDFDITWSSSSISVFRIPSNLDQSSGNMFLEFNEVLKDYVSNNVEDSVPKKKTKAERLRTYLKKSYVKIRNKLNIVYRHHKQC